MNYQQTLEQSATQINNELADLQSLNVNEIMTKLQSLINTGYQQYIIETIRSCILHYQNDRAIIKYGYIVDKLIKLPVFNQMVQNVIVQFFCDIFIFLLNQKCYNQIDELKILRKFWLKTIHPRHLQAMRDILLAETTIDIDQHFKQEVIVALKNHYEKKLKLTPEQMKFYLPKTLKTSNIVYETKTTKTQSEKLFNQNQNYIISHQSNIPMNVSINQQAQVNQTNFVKRSMSPEPRMNPMNYSINVNQYQSVQPNTYYPSNQMIPRQSFHMKVAFTKYSQTNIPQRVSPPIDPRDPRVMAQKRYQVQQPQIMQVQQPKIMQVQQQNVPFYPEKAEYATKDNFKRERFYSQESKTTNGSEYLYNNIPWGPKTQVLPNIPYQIEGQPHKKVHCDESFDFSKRDLINKFEQKQPQRTERPKHAKMLEMLRGDRMFKCKQCGKGFKNMSDYDKHLNEHFEERLMIREKRKTAQRLMNLDEWTQSKSHNSLQQFDQFYITVSNLNSEEQINFQPLQLKCRLCNQTFDLKFSKDNWVLNNATFCLVDGQKIPMHKTCQQALDDSSSSQNL